MRYALPALLLLAPAALPAFGGEHARDYFFFVTPVVPVAPTPPAPAPAPAPPAPKAPRATDGRPSGDGRPSVAVRRPTDGVDPDRVASALGSCVRCHSAPNPKGKTLLFNEAGAFAPAVAPAAVYASVADDSMPLSGPKLSKADKDLLRRWAGIPLTKVTP
jgi:hypothetical protein